MLHSSTINYTVNQVSLMGSVGNGAPVSLTGVWEMGLWCFKWSPVNEALVGLKGVSELGSQ